MSINNWPAQERPREKLLAKGEQNLTDAELVAILFKSGLRGKSALDLAREWLQEQGNLKKGLQTSLHAFIKKPGLGVVKYATLRAAVELGRRYLQQPLPSGSVLKNPRATQQYIAQQLSEHDKEVFACLFLDNHLRLICYEELFYGTINEANIYPREIVRRSLLQNAVNVILAHNHPGGNPTPSHADKEITSLIEQALALVDVQVVDHIIIGNPNHFSFAESGLLILRSF